ncbi:hypothetical protein EES44_30540 [Streptomyces sp. ADI96-15]|nr:hypothetical protein EES44_30540 [Streptomyces sp. ADI96-15]
MLRKTGRDSRKHALRALISTQDTQDIAAAGVANWIDAMWVGRTTGDEAARAALRLLGIAPEPGYVDLLAGLSPRQDAREFVFSDGAGGMERVTVTVAPELRAALDSTPRRPASDPWTKAAAPATASSSSEAGA